MNALFTGLYVRYNDASAESVALRASLTNGLFAYEPPQGTEFPYVTYFLVSDVPWDRLVERGEDALIQFDIFSKKSTTTVDPATEACELYDLLDAVYDECYLTITGYTHVSIKREFAELPPPDEDSVYQYSITYRILIEKI